MSLGLVATGKRAIKPGTEYEKYFDLSRLENTDPIIIADGDNYDTLRKIDEIAKRYAWQTEKIAEILKGDTLEESLRNLWEFLYNHVQYKLDNPKREQLRTPLRTWKDRASGVDCDCYTVFIKSVLNNWGITNASRMAAYKKDFQHVYVVVPKDGRGSSLEVRDRYFVVDPVVNAFNYEVPFSKKYDRFMSLSSVKGLASLGGLGHITLGDCPSSTPVATTAPGAPKAAPVTTISKNPYANEWLRISYIEESGMVSTEKFLKQNGIAYEEIYLSDGSLRYRVSTGSGQTIDVIPVIGPQDAAELLSKVNAVKQEVSGMQGTDAKFPVWGWFAIGAAAITVAAIAFTGNKPKKESSGTAGLSAPPKRKASRKLKSYTI